MNGMLITRALDAVRGELFGGHTARETIVPTAMTVTSVAVGSEHAAA